MSVASRVRGPPESPNRGWWTVSTPLTPCLVNRYQNPVLSNSIRTLDLEVWDRTRRRVTGLPLCCRRFLSSLRGPPQVLPQDSGRRDYRSPVHGR